jgi:hypothetical protein
MLVNRRMPRVQDLYNKYQDNKFMLVKNKLVEIMMH